MASYRPEGLFQTLLDRVQYWPNAIGRSAGRKLDRRYKRRAAHAPLAPHALRGICRARWSKAPRYA